MLIELQNKKGNNKITRKSLFQPHEKETTI